MKLTSEQVEFKEFEIGDFLFSGNLWYRKVNDTQAEVLNGEVGTGILLHFNPDRLCNIVV
jgi:hypothetical protein